MWETVGYYQCDLYHMGESMESQSPLWKNNFYRAFLAYQMGSPVGEEISMQQFLAFMYTIMVEVYNVLSELLCIFPVIRATLVRCDLYEIHGCSGRKLSISIIAIYLKAKNCCIYIFHGLLI